MAAEIINLRKARKARDRADKQRRAEENRAKFGRTKAERETSKLDNTRTVRRLDAHRRDDSEEGGEPSA
jgi:hypothetical protein